MTDREYDEAIAQLPEDVRARVRAYQGIPLGAAYALNQEQQAIQASLSDLKESLQAISHTLLRLVGEHDATLAEHDNRINGLDKRLRKVEDQLGICG